MLQWLHSSGIRTFHCWKESLGFGFHPRLVPYKLHKLCWEQGTVLRILSSFFIYLAECNNHCRWWSCWYSLMLQWNLQSLFHYGTDPASGGQRGLVQDSQCTVDGNISPGIWGRVYQSLWHDIHGLFVLRIGRCGVYRWTTRWVTNWLNCWVQGVLFDHSGSDKSQATSGIFQGCWYYADFNCFINLKDGMHTSS